MLNLSNNSRFRRNNCIFVPSKILCRPYIIMYTYRYPHPAVTTDCVVLSRGASGLEVLLIKRGNAPCKGQWAFPGGFLNIDESAEDGARRELYEETHVAGVSVTQIGAYSAVDRDPRERVITIAYYAIIEKQNCDVRSGDDAAEARWFSIDALPELAFDHADILRDALRRIV